MLLLRAWLNFVAGCRNQSQRFREQREAAEAELAASRAQHAAAAQQAQVQSQAHSTRVAELAKVRQVACMLPVCNRMRTVAQSRRVLLAVIARHAAHSSWQTTRFLAEIAVRPSLRLLTPVQALEASQAAAEEGRQAASDAAARAARYKRAFKDIDQMISWARTPSSARRSGDASTSAPWGNG